MSRTRTPSLFASAGGMMALLVVAVLLACGAPRLAAAEVIPPSPENHFNDYAHLVPAATAAQLNQELAQFERDTSNQLVVAIYPKMQSDSSVEDYAVRVAQKWGVGQKGRNNGAVLFVFQQSHDVYIATGYGLEGALPDALCKRIVEDEIVPRFRSGDFAGGLAAGVHAMMAAARGEYKGTGRTAHETQSRGTGDRSGLVFGLIIVVIVLISAFRARAQQNVMYGRRGRRSLWTNGPWGGWGGPWGGGGWGGGGGWSGGGGGGGGGTFSGGGGSFGGGGAGGKW